MAAVQQIYNYSLEMNYVLDNVATFLSQDLVKYFVIEYDYDNKNMPIIYMSVTVTKEVYDKLNYQVDKGYISLVVKKKQTNAKLPVWTNYIESQFTYFILDATEETKQVNDTGGTSKQFNGDEFRVLELALLKTDIMNGSKRVYNTVLNNVTLMDAVHYGTSHFPMIIEPTALANFSSLLIPPITSTSKYLKYIDGLKSLYGGSYRFFIDFSRGYVLSTSGRAVPAKGDVANSVIIITEQAAATMSKFSGQEYDDTQKAYTIRIPHNEAVETKNNIVNKRYNNIIGVSASGKTDTQKLTTLTDTYGTTKTIMMRINNENIDSVASVKTDIENTSFYLQFNKGELDTSIITPNMEYSYTSLSNSEFSGKYLLSKKQEIFKRNESGKFVADIAITLKKIMS